MSDRIEYTVTMRRRHWWGGKVRHVLIGTGSSVKDRELLIHQGSEGLNSFNFDYVERVEAKVIEHHHDH